MTFVVLYQIILQMSFDIGKKERLRIHYHLLQNIRKKRTLKYLPFRYIRMKINKKIQLENYKINNDIDYKVFNYIKVIRWNDSIKTVKYY